jgi:hypothetical protein
MAAGGIHVKARTAGCQWSIRLPGVLHMPFNGSGRRYGGMAVSTAPASLPIGPDPAPAAAAARGPGRPPF